MRKLLAAALIAAPLAACQTAADPRFDSPALAPIVATPTITRTRIQSPDPDKWTGRTVRAHVSEFICRPLACPAKSFVRATTSQAPTRKIDEAALKEFAKTTVPANVKAANIKLDAATSSYEHLTLKSTKTTQLRGFPAVVVEVTKTGAGEPKHGVRAYLFAGNTLIDTFSVSTRREVALENLHAFINAYGIEDGPKN